MSAMHGYLKPAAVQKVGPTGHVVMEASAGTGKTFTLEHLVVEQVLSAGLRLDQVLVVTFTDKATREMRRRVRDTFLAVAQTPTDHPHHVAADHPGAWRVDDAARQRVAANLAVFDHAPISTIHSFCQRVLAEHAFASGRLLQQAQVDARTLFGTVFRQQLRQCLAADHPLKDALQVMLEREGAARLEQRVFQLGRLQGELLPNGGPEQLAAALQQLPPPARFESILWPDLRRHLSNSAASSMYPHLRTVIGAADRLQRTGSLLEPLRMLLALQDARATMGTRRPAALLLDQLPKIRSRAVEHHAVLDHLATVVQLSHPMLVMAHGLLPRVREALRDHKDAHGLMDFDDMLSMLAHALTGPRGPALTAALRQRFRVALVDEFQDTDDTQWDIFRALFVDGAEGHRLMVIGDPKQAIYGFRNADVHTYRRAVEHLQQHGAQMVPLTENHRSSTALVDAYNRVFTAADFFTGINRYDHPVVVPEGKGLAALVGADGAAMAPICVTRVSSAQPDWMSAVMIQRALARFAAEESARLLAGAHLADTQGTRLLQPGDIQVLVSKGAEAEEVARCMRRVGVPVALYKQDGLFQTPQAQHLATVLRALEDLGDSSRRLQAWLTPLFGLAVQHLPRVMAQEDQPVLMGHLQRWRQLAEEHRYPALFDAMVEESGLGRRELFFRDSTRALTNYRQVADVLVAEAERHHLDLASLIARMDAYLSGDAVPPGEAANTQRLETQGSAVQVLTVHKAKGLEAPVVFLAGGISQYQAFSEPVVFHNPEHLRRVWVLPERTKEVRDQVAQERDEEAQRLIYVALTRPRVRLYVPYLGALAGRPLEDREAMPRSEVTGVARALFPALAKVVTASLANRDGAFEWREWPVEDERATPVASQRLGPAASVPPVAQPPLPNAERFAALARNHTGPQITHYTRLKAQQEGGWSETGVELDELVAEYLESAGMEAAKPDDLVGGAAMGIYLHAMLEEVDAQAVAGEPDAEQWVVRDDVTALARVHAVRCGLEWSQAQRALPLVHTCLRAPLHLGDTMLPNGLVATSPRAAEMSFLYPIPEGFHPQRAAGPDGPPFVAGRGFIRGVVDLVFEHEGRTWFVDYKSDRLADWSDATLQQHTAAHYGMQVALYTLGICRLLGVTSNADYQQRFGGLVYLFLRGMDASDGRRGVHFERPTWESVSWWERTLRNTSAPWWGLGQRTP